jgi:protein-S-isoprenylcysteine O-methyltransferase Ste14
MYSGFILWVAGWTTYNGSGATAVIALICVADILLWRRFEERDLEAKYGEAYRTYRKTSRFYNKKSHGAVHPDGLMAIS